MSLRASSFITLFCVPIAFSNIFRFLIFVPAASGPDSGSALGRCRPRNLYSLRSLQEYFTLSNFTTHVVVRAEAFHDPQSSAALAGSGSGRPLFAVRVRTSA
jgi:hypothetical protein